MTKAKPADDYRMMGLAEIIKRAHADRNSLALGIDSEAVITAMSAIPEAGSSTEAASMGPQSTGSALSVSADSGSTLLVLGKVLSSPWAEVGLPPRRTAASGASHHPLAPNSLETILPVCYNVQAPPPAATRIGAFTEETLFYMFYGMPRDRMQEMAARELTLARGWRYHKELRLWILPASATPTASSMTAGISALRMSPAPTGVSTATGAGSLSSKASPGLDDAITASYIVFDPNTWSKVRRELPVLHEDLLEDRLTSVAVSPK